MYTACGFNNSNIEIHHIHMNNLNRISMLHGASLVAQMVKNPPGFDSWIGKFIWRRACNPLQYSCLENPHGQRSLAGYTVGTYKITKTNVES